MNSIKIALYGKKCRHCRNDPQHFVLPLKFKPWRTVLGDGIEVSVYTITQGSNFIAAIAVEGEQNAVDHCGNDGKLLPYSAIFILFTVHYNNYFDT